MVYYVCCYFEEFKNKATRYTVIEFEKLQKM